VVPAVIDGRDVAGALLFIFPLAVQRCEFLRQLTWLGSELCDYNAPLLAPHFSKQVGAARFMQIWRDIRRRLQDHPNLRYSLVNLSKMPDKVGDQANPFLLLGVGIHPSGAYRTDLGDDWETFYTEKRSSATRQRDRTKRKKLAKLGEIRFINPDAADLGRTLETLIEQKVQALARMGVANLFARPGYREFYHGLATEPATRHLVHVSRLDVGTTAAAINLALMFRGSYYHVLASYDGGEVSKYGAGAAHLQDLMRHAIERKCSVFDFTIGDERYKRDWCDTGLTLFDHVAAATLKGWPVLIASLASSRLKRWIKQTPAVWNAFTKARAFLRR